MTTIIPNFITKTNSPLTFKPNTTDEKPQKNITDSPSLDYTDPLAKWPVRGLAYSNELGTAIGEIAPKLGTLLWVPALMYFGADIYDKYKNQETNYNPSTKRGLEQAIFQSLASVILPTVAVHSGQKLISEANRFSKTGLSTNAKEETLNFIKDFINKSKLSNFNNNFECYTQKFNTSLNTYIDDTKGVERSKNIFSKALKWAFSTKHPEAISNANSENLVKYANEQLKKLLEIRTSLMNGEKSKNISDKIFLKFINIQESFKKEFGEANYLHKAAKYALKEQLTSNIFKLKMFKTLGGFIALGLMIKPIDIFVEQTVMKKIVEPNIEKIKYPPFRRKNK